MRVLQRLGSGIERRHVLVVLMVAVVALAGCSSLGGGGDDADTETVIQSTVESIDGVESYSITGSLNQSIQTANGQQNVTIQLNSSIDRANERISSSQTVDAGIRTFTTESYIVDGTLYQHSQLFVQQFNSEWVKVSISDRFSDRFNQNDELAGHRVMLENSSVELVGTQEIDGESAYRLEMDVNESALASFYGFDDSTVEIQGVNTTIWVSTETNRLLRASGELRQQVTAQGQELTTTTSYDERFSYETVNISLPAEANSAVEINQTTGLMP